MAMNRSNPTWDYVETMAQLADLKEALYRNTLALSAMLELLVDRGFISPEEFHEKTAAFEREDTRTAELAMRYDAPTSSQAVDLS